MAAPAPNARRAAFAASLWRQPGAVAAQHLCRDTAGPGYHHRAGYRFPCHADDHLGAAGDHLLGKDPGEAGGGLPCELFVRTAHVNRRR